MAGTARSATIPNPSFGYDLAADWTGQNPSLGVAFVQHDNGENGGQYDPTLTPPDFIGLGTITAAGGSADPKPDPTERAMVDPDDIDKVTPAGTWFERVHLLPRGKIEFGNILSLIENGYELFNAYRELTVSETSIVNNASPGVELPNNTPTEAIGPLSSLLDPSSTGQTLSALGTLVLTKVRATADGLPVFDTSIDFVFASPAGTVTLLVSGSRIVLLPFEYEKPCVELLEFLTDVIEGLDGKEQRISVRKNPRQLFELEYRLDGNQRQRMRALLFDWTDNIFGLPLWHEQLRLTAPVSIGATSYPVSGADDVDLRVGGLAAIIADDATFDVLNLSAVTDTQLTSGDPSVNAYPAGTPIMPLRTARVPGRVPGQRSPVVLESFRLTLETTDNDTGLPAASTTPGFWSIDSDGRVLFDDCNVVEGSAPESFGRRMFLLDSRSGAVAQTSPWDRGKITYPKGFSLRSRAQILQFRRLLLALRGKQTAFKLPTSHEDLTVVADLASGSALMDVDSLEYVRFVRERVPMVRFRITFTDGTSLIRTVSSSATVSGTVERLTLNDTWPATRTPAEVVRVQFIETVRSDTDSIRIAYPQIGRARVEIPTVRVFDDN